MDWRDTPYVLPLVFAALLSGLVALSAWGRRPAPGALPLALLMLAAAEWSLGYAFELASPGLAGKLLWAKIEYLGIAAIPLTWIAFALQYSGREHWLTPRTLVALAIVPLATVTLAWTNEAHGLIWRVTRLSTEPGVPVLALEYGSWFGVHVAYSYLLLLLGTILLLRALLRSPQLYRGQAGALLSAALLPWVVNVIYLAGLNPFPGLDLTPFAFVGSGLILSWGIFRFQLLDVVPVARDAVIESMSDGIIVLDRQNRIVDLNPAAEGIIGAPASHVVGQAAAEFVPGWASFVAEAGALAEAESEIALGEGQFQRFYEPRISPLRDRRGHPAGHLVVLHDRTERKHAEEAIQQARELAERLVHSSVDGVLAFDRDYRYTVWNPAMERISGMSRAETLGQRAFDVLPFLQESGEARYFAEALAGNTVVAKDRPFVVPATGRQGIFEGHYSPLRNERGEIIGGLAIIHDVTERKRAEEERLQLLREQAARAAAEEAIGARDLFLSVASHELRTPITALQGYADLLQRYAEREGISQPQLQRGLRAISDQAGRLNRLIESLMDLSRIQSGHLSMERLPLDLTALVRRVAEAHEAMLEHHTLELNAPEEAVIVEADELRLEQVLQNLLGNAIKYSPDGGRIQINLCRRDERVCLEVSDEGVGIPRDALPHLFDPFYRAGTSDTRRIGGLGLGLAVVKEIVTRHEGTIEVLSTEGEGSTFTICLPIPAQ